MWTYTIDQVLLFYKAGGENAYREIGDTAYAVRVGTNANKREWDKFIGSINATRKAVARQQGNNFSMADANRLQSLLSGGKKKVRKNGK